MTSVAGLSAYVVVVARDDAPHDSISSFLSAQGARVIALPLMRTELLEPAGLDRSLAALRRFDGIAFSSPSAARFVGAQCMRLGLSPESLNELACIAAVGRKTADTLKAIQVRVDVVGDGGGAELADQLVGWLRDHRTRRIDSSSWHVLLPRALGGRDELQMALERHGVWVEAVDVYRSIPRADADVHFHHVVDILEAHQGPCAIVLTSPKRVEVFASCWANYKKSVESMNGAQKHQPSKTISQKIPDCTWIAIGQVTRASMAENGLPPARAAARPTPEAIVAALLA